MVNEFLVMYYNYRVYIYIQIKLFAVDQKVKDLLKKANECTINKILSQNSQNKIQLIKYNYASNVFL